jgi:hypothetical protein
MQEQPRYADLLTRVLKVEADLRERRVVEEYKARLEEEE